MQAYFFHPRTNLPILGNPTLLEANIRDGDEIKYSLPGSDGVGDSSCMPTLSQEFDIGSNDPEMASALAASASMATGRNDSSGKRGKEKGFTGSRFGGAAAAAGLGAGTGKLGASSKVEPKQWTCRACTFENAAIDRKCAVCGGGN